jgi:hypothetical protein
MKYYPAIAAALGFFILVLLGLRWEVCEVDLGAAAHAATTPTEPWELPGDPSTHLDCVPMADDALVIAPCVDEGRTSTEWASTSDGFVAHATWEDLAGVQAVAVYCEYASVAVGPYRREQVLAVLSDGRVEAPCDGAHFIHFFAP